MKDRKNISIKISTAINLITAISVITIITLSLVGYNKIILLRGNIESMYNSDVKKIELSRSIATKTAEIQSDVKNQILEYDSDLDAAITNNMTTLNNSIESYLKISNDENEKNSADNLQKVIEEYNSNWTSINEDLKAGSEIDSQRLALIVVNEKMVIYNLNRLVQNNGTNAQEKYFQSEIAAQNAGSQFLIIGASGLIILILISAAIMHSTKSSLSNMVETMKLIAEGNFKIEIDTKQKNEFGIMNNALDKTLKSVSNMVSEIMKKTNSIVNESKSLDDVAKDMLVASKDVYNATKVMAEGSTSQAQDLMSIDKQFDEFSDMLNGIIDAVIDIEKSNKDIHVLTTTGENGIHTLISSSKNVESSFIGFEKQLNKFADLIAKINDIIEVITGLAGQTKLLSLNASIEAARAGEHGKGFAVVAQEVNKLSEESRISAEKITNLIETIYNSAQDILNKTKEMGSELNIQQSNTESITDCLKNIIDKLEISTSKINVLSSSANGIINERNKLIDRVVNASSIAEEISASAEEIAASASQMDSHANLVVSSAKNLTCIVDETSKELNKFEV